MADHPREAWITGIGIVSSLGEGADAHWEALNERRLLADATSFAPYLVHPLASLDLDKQIPKKGDQRQMEPWQRIGTYAAGLALDHAGVSGNPTLLGGMDLIVAASGGERDVAVDGAVLSGAASAADPDAFLNERLMNDLRPTLFLAQLSNLLAGNISIVHGVTGSSRTFMGEEAAGVDAVRIALARIAAGQSEIALVGGASNAERKDHLLPFEFGGFVWKGEPGEVWERGEHGGGFAPGSMGAFLVIEARTHAEARGAKPLARLSAVLSSHSDRRHGGVAAALERMFDQLMPQLARDRMAIISGASGAQPATAEEHAFLMSRPDLPARATGTYVGHGVEAQFPMNIALAAVAARKGSLFAEGGGANAVEKPFAGTLNQALVTGVGHWRGEGMALVEAVGDEES